MWKRSVRIAGVAIALAAVLAASWMTGAMVIRHPWVNGLANDLIGLATGTCTAAACESLFSVDVGQELAEGVVYDIRVCLDAECWDVETVFDDGISWSDSPLSVGRDGGLTVLLGDRSRPLVSDVKVEVWADGIKIVDHEGTVTFEVHRPNGRFCDPICYRAALVL